MKKKQVYVQVMDSEEYMPVTFINGTRDGKTVLVTHRVSMEENMKVFMLPAR